MSVGSSRFDSGSFRGRFAQARPPLEVFAGHQRLAFVLNLGPFIESQDPGPVVEADVPFAAGIDGSTGTVPQPSARKSHEACIRLSGHSTGRPSTRSSTMRPSMLTPVIGVYRRGPAAPSRGPFACR